MIWLKWSATVLVVLSLLMLAVKKALWGWSLSCVGNIAMLIWGVATQNDHIVVLSAVIIICGIIGLVKSL